VHATPTRARCNPSRDPPPAPSPASGCGSPVQSRAYGTIVCVAGLSTVPTRGQSEDPTRIGARVTVKGRAQCVAECPWRVLDVVDSEALTLSTRWPSSLPRLNQEGERLHVPRVCSAPALSCAARSVKYTWKRRVGEGNSEVWVANTAASHHLHQVHSSSVPPWSGAGCCQPVCAALGTVAPTARSWSVLTLLWGGERGACTRRVGGRSFAAWWCRV
jgi:hypothetical protein